MGFLRTFDMLFTKNSDQETLKIPFVAISFKSSLRLTGLSRAYVINIAYYTSKSGIWLVIS